MIAVISSLASLRIAKYLQQPPDRKYNLPPILQVVGSYIVWMGIQDPKMEVLHHIRPYVLGLYPYIAHFFRPSKNGIGTSNQSVPVAWPLEWSQVNTSFRTMGWVYHLPRLPRRPVGFWQPGWIIKKSFYFNDPSMNYPEKSSTIDIK